MFKTVLPENEVQRCCNCCANSSSVLNSCCKNNCSTPGEELTKERCEGVTDPCMDEFFNVELEPPVQFWTSVDSCVEKMLRDTPVETTLVGQSTYFLNKSNSKWVAVGLSPQYNFDPYVKVAGIKKQCVTLSEYEWEKFLSEKATLKKHFKKSKHIFPTMNVFNLKISCECLDGYIRIIKIEKDKDVLYLSYEGLEELWRLAEVVNTRMEYLKSLHYEKHYAEMLDYLSKREGNLDNEVQKMMNGVVSEYGVITKELVVNAMYKVYNDISMLKNVIV